MSHSPPTPSNTLLERPASVGSGPTALAGLLDRPAETDLLVVSYEDGPDSWLREFESCVGDLPPEVGFVNVGVKTRSPTVGVASPSSSGGRSSPDPSGSRSSPDGTLPTTAVVSDSTDLARVGVRASEYLEAWEGDGRRTVVVLDSVTALLADVPLDRAFGFLHVFAGRVESVDGLGYYMLDPAAHDEQVVSVVRELADGVVGLDPSDGS